MAQSLRERLIGAWELIDVVEEPVDGSPARHPMGERPLGLILYTPDGYMSAQIMQQGHAAAGTAADAYGRTAADYAEEARTYFAYSGPYEVDEERGVLTHTMTVSLFPGWVGQSQPRVARLEGGVLHLSSEGPSLSAGVLVTTHITWRRAGGSAASGA
jgi:hypothetical protein